MAKLQGKVAIITGGISGIGAASTRLFAQEGAKLVLVDLNEEKGQAFIEDLSQAGFSDAIFIQADVSSEADTVQVFDETIAKFGKIDIMFNNAGIGRTLPTEEVTFEEYRKVIAVDLDAVFLYSQTAIKDMLKNSGGVIINTASMYGWVGAAGSAAYNAAKGGVINLTRSLGVEYAERHIRVNALCPGYIDTPIIPEETKALLASTTPINRLGTAEEMAKAALFLASDDSSYMTANTLTVDGGYTAQ